MAEMMGKGQVLRNAVLSIPRVVAEKEKRRHHLAVAPQHPVDFIEITADNRIAQMSEDRGQNDEIEAA